MKNKHLNLITVLLLIVLFFVIVYFISGLVKIMKLEKEERELMIKKEELTAVRDELLLQYSSVRSSDYLENAARSKLKLVRPEEVIFLYNDEDE